ncbi:PREDICTED: uncharacterized protein LOC107086526 isoform X3 [Cyprinodon variegatus]|uniref:uncharacterized protein LOC107086526 isoform X3 n=1 Tax=Cyprinodon variegatus TaxID=28743 RepID=UPI000742C3B4|nr:PREDICTED: uncharacterized protein LOC107086526 isoform X3 [Cyprinodon variegatus]
MSFLSNIPGGDGIAKVAGEKAGEIVEQGVNKIMGGGADKGGQQQQQQEGEKKEGGGGGFGLDDALSMVSGKKEEKEGGFGLDDALSMVSGKKEEKEGGGGGIGNFVGGLFK